MPELRYNVISREWVVIATERAKRPEDFIKPKKDTKPLPEHRPDCPFCPGNEEQSPGEIFRIPGEKGWRTRVVFNKYGALLPTADKARNREGMNVSMGGFGFHEVLIENPRHNTCIALMNDSEVEDIVETYKNRYLALMQAASIEAITIFKNHGPQAGTSQEHPHSQLIATPIVPPLTRTRIEQAVRFFDVMGKCIFCFTLEQELQEKKRIILETEHFVAFMPHAALTPFHTWIFPRRHMGSFSEINSAEVKDFASCLKQTLAKLYHGLENPDFNFTIRSTPVRECRLEYYHWYLSLVPRITQTAGFELGSGMFINISLPEQSAQFLRQVK